MQAISQSALMTHLTVGLAERAPLMLEVMKGTEKALTVNRRRRRKGDRKRRDLMNSSRARVTLSCKNREKIVPQQRSFTTGLVQGGIEERVAGRSSLGRVEVEGRGVKAGKKFQMSGV